ncbi:MAG: PD-(D/E)XK nuclease family protein [Candidatus Micrarchaeia archaeon]
MAFSLSPSTLSLYHECPRCFWLHFNGVKRPVTIFPSLPSGMDRILKAHFARYMKKKELPPELRMLGSHVSLFDDEHLLSEWTNNRKGLHYEDEHGNMLRGAVDAILVKGKKLVVLDFKTRGFPLKDDTAQHYQNQLDIYNFLLRKTGFGTEDYSYLLFYHPHEVTKNGKIDFVTDLVKMGIYPKNAQNLFSEALTVLEGKKPKADPGCGFCKWGKEWR